MWHSYACRKVLIRNVVAQLDAAFVDASRYRLGGVSLDCRGARLHTALVEPAPK